MPAPDELDTAVATRMGYGNTLRAAVFHDRGVAIEIALFGPHDHWKEFGVPVHWDCDPDDQTRGSSEMNNFATLEEAVAGYEAEFARIAAEIRPVQSSSGPTA